MPNPNLPNNPGYNLYVGARYVPIFDGEWVATKSYEPLTIVQYLGDSYTSKTFVAAGIAPTDETYWAMTGQYNAQIEDLRGEIANNTADIVELDNRTQANTESIGNINTSISGINNSISSLNAKTSGSKVIITDSYGTIISNVNTTSYTQILQTWFNDLIVSAHAGDGFCNGGFLNQLNTLQNNGNVKDVYFCGGWNDNAGVEGNSLSSLKSAASSVVNSAKLKFPNAKLHVIFISSGSNSSKLPDLNTAFGWYNSVFPSLGIELFSSPSFNISKSDYFSSNPTHPNNQGHETLAISVANCINGVDLEQKITGTITAVINSNGFSGGLSIPTNRKGEILATQAIFFQPLTGPSSFTFTGDALNIGSISSWGNARMADIRIVCVIRVNTKFYNAQLLIRQNGTVTLQPERTAETVDMSALTMSINAWCGILF